VAALGRRAIIALLVSILLPSLSAARASAKTSACASHLRTFSSGFEIYANQDLRLARRSGAFDHRRDGDVREIGWVADMIRLRVGTPGKMLCPTNRWTISEKVADYTGAAAAGSDAGKRFATWPWTRPAVSVSTISQAGRPPDAPVDLSSLPNLNMAFARR